VAEIPADRLRGSKTWTGEPLPGATVRIGETEGVTDDDGRVVLDVDAEPGDRVRVVVIDGGEAVFDQPVEVRPGALIPLTTRAEVPVPLVLGDPYLGAGGRGADGRRSLVWVWGWGSGESIDPKLDAQSFDIVTTFDGVVVPDQTTSGSLSREQIRTANQSEEKLHKDRGYGVSLEFGRHSIGNARERVAREVAGKRWRFFPAVSVGLGQADFEFRSRSLVDDAQATFKGDGLIYGGGLRGTLFGPGGDWFTTVGYQIVRSEEIDVTRSPGLQSSLPTGIEAVEDRGRYRAQSDSLVLTFGRNFRNVTPWAGVRGVRFHSDLDVDLRIRAVGVPAEQSQSARNEYEEDLTLGVAGLDFHFRLSGTDLTVRAEGSTDGDNSSFAIGVGFGFLEPL
jgi:hypothetical protein